MLTLALKIQPVRAEPRTWTVDDDGPADFHTIARAINAASDGDTTYVYNGTYYEHVVINKTISLIGEHSARDSELLTRKDRIERATQN
jgi:pectin methylesterase-like acyl-CoA thioesterase